jgi:membrane protease YdiL (CAAX protease family)
MNQPPGPEQRLSPWYAVGFYLVMGAGGLAWAAFLEGPSYLSPNRQPTLLVSALGLGVAAAVAVHGVSLLLERWIKSLKALSEEMRAVFGRLGHAQVLAFSFSSALGEELLFRAALLPATGLVVSSLVFGAAHGFFHPRYLAWSLFAVAMGFVLGGLTLWTGNVVAAVICHFTVNYWALAEWIPEDDVS